MSNKRNFFLSLGWMPYAGDTCKLLSLDQKIGAASQNLREKDSGLEN
jgi:hypothetical protein